MSVTSFFAKMDRRKLIIWGGAGTIALIIIIIIIAVSTSGSSKVTTGRDALLNSPLIDGHNDLPNNLREILKNRISNFDFDTNLVNDQVWGTKACKVCHTDLVRLTQGLVGAQFWVAYVNCTTQYKDAVAETLEQIDVIRRLVKKYPEKMELVTTADGIVEAFENKKLGSLIGVEGGHSIDSRLGVLRTFYDLGVRYMTLTHTCTTPWADASVVKEPVHNLTEFGKKIVQEMNRLGMMVDLSHVSHNVMREAIDISTAPVIFSHSCAYKVHAHHRNVPDDVLEKLQNNGGVVMINFYTEFLAPNNTKVNISTVMKHINYIVDKIGVDHVGIGGDYDGVEKTPVGLEDVSKYPDLFDMLHHNDSERWSISNLEKLAGKNLLRVFRKVEDVRNNMAKENTIENWIPKEDMVIVPEELTVCRTEIDVEDNNATTVTTIIPTNETTTKITENST